MKSRFNCENKVTVFSVAKECSRFALSDLLGFVEANGLRWDVNLKCVMSRLGVGDFIGMYDALRLCDPNRQRLDIGYAFVKCPVSFCVTDSLIEQINEVVKQRVLLINVECQYSVKESRHVVELFFAYSFAPFAIADR